MGTKDATVLFVNSIQWGVFKKSTIINELKPTLSLNSRKYCTVCTGGEVAGIVASFMLQWLYCSKYYTVLFSIPVPRSSCSAVGVVSLPVIVWYSCDEMQIECMRKYDDGFIICAVPLVEVPVMSLEYLIRKT